jgi:hypothetical protein
MEYACRTHAVWVMCLFDVCVYDDTGQSQPVTDSDDYVHAQ